MDIYARALEIKNEIITHRRYLHKNAEVGTNTPRSKTYAENVLAEMNIRAVPCGCGLTAVIGNGAPVILLRADMDALPMREESGEGFACTSGKAAHTCGHDLHAAMLLGAAQILKERESQLCGTVKLMFQPGEETLEGCRDMIAHGVLEDPKVTSAIAFHVGAGKIPPGKLMYNARGVLMFSSDSFRIWIKGKGGHGAYPDLTVDPLRIAVHIYCALESLVGKEVSPTTRCSLTVGHLSGGVTGNVIPDEAVLEGSLRADSQSAAEKLKQRVREISKACAEMMGGSVEVTFKSSVPPLVCDSELTEKVKGYLMELNVPWEAPEASVTSSASEDFSLIAERVPSAYMYLTSGFNDERGEYLAHNPKVLFNEDVCPIGAAGLAHCAIRWLEENGKRST